MHGLLQEKRCPTFLLCRLPSLQRKMKGGDIKVLDVRKPGEFSGEHVEDAISLPLDFLNKSMDELDRNETYHIHCASGYRSIIFSSIIMSRGFTKLYDIAGGYQAISETDIPVTDFVCPSTLKD